MAAIIPRIVTDAPTIPVAAAAATGIVGASVTILGIIAAKSMNRSGYDVRLAAGTITAGGTLGILIPPSIMLVVMGPIMEIPVTDLFAAAAANKSVTGISIIGPITTSIILGGIKIPKVPPAVIVPAANLTS